MGKTTTLSLPAIDRALRRSRKLTHFTLGCVLYIDVKADLVAVDKAFKCGWNGY
jgi:hypothetical protein